jgi:aminoglycoside 6'-N-acetyltransferase I
MLRHDLWPDATKQELRLDAEALMRRPAQAVAFLAWTEAAAVGFAEARLRTDYVNGCDTSPVAFLEGIYVHAEWRRCGIARGLCKAVEDWATGLGCTEFASDALLENTISHHMHAALDFEETERVVFYRKRLQLP